MAEVLPLTTDGENDVAGFLNRKRQWLFSTVKAMNRTTAGRHAAPRFMTGPKIPYRGRNMSLVVRPSDAGRLTITYRNGFVVGLPHWAGQNTDGLIANEIKHWLKQQVRRDVTEIAADNGKRFGIEPRSIRAAGLAGSWGSCGPGGTVMINWHLVFAPRRVLEYGVVHELAHVEVRSHEYDFWELLGRLIQGFDDSRRWLENSEGDLSSEFLEAS